MSDADSDSDCDKELEVPQRIVYDSVSEQRRQCAKRQEYEYSKNVVTIGHYVAYTTDYIPETLEKQRQDVWLPMSIYVNVHFQ